MRSGSTDDHCDGDRRRLTLGLEERPALLLGADIIGRFARVSLDFGLSRMTFSGLRRQPPPSVVAV